MLIGLARRPRQIYHHLPIKIRSMNSFLNAHRPADWKNFAPDPLPGTLTFGSQASLPKLPVPELTNTLTRLKETLKPIAWSEEEYQTALTKIDEFGAGLGPKLQERLLKFDQQKPHWLEQFWDDLGYLGYRDSVGTRSFN